MLPVFWAKAKKLLATVVRWVWFRGSRDSAVQPERPEYQLQWTDTAGNTGAEEVVIAGVSPRVLRVRCSVALEPGSSATLSGDASARGIVTRCTRQAGRYLVEILCAVDRRKVTREVSRGVGTLDWWSDAGGAVHLPTRVTNLSDQGAQLRASEPVPMEAIVRLSSKNVECAGVVRYCTTEADHYVVGLQFVEEPHVRIDR